VAQQIEKWPSEAVVWSGDRVRGLHVYELVRDGHYLSLLPREEVARLEKRGLTEATGRAVMRGIDDDQHFYLTAMRQMIEGCRLPYFARAPLLQRIRQELADLEQTPRYPLVAAERLLTDFEIVHRRLAADSARAEAWELAFRTAEGNLPSPNVNPLTSEPFFVERIDRSVAVSRFVPDDENQRVLVPTR
jgi:hypothetical protein